MSSPDSLATPGAPNARFSAIAVRKNTQIVQYARSSLAFISGAAAGILGIEGWIGGFAFYLASSLLLSLLLWAKTGGNSKKYFPRVEMLWTEEVTGNAFSYLLFWTLAYGLVHIYD
ncbi:transmembrane protein 93-like protein [Gaertneriomyces semiglobifer]|nr:transmembrane protein 93-like protein [Gaertneriomyces semiglobifer]